MFRRRTKTTHVTFGEKGKVGVMYLGDLPFEHRGVYTGKNYVWHRPNWPLWVDKRDLPGLVKAVGRDLLESAALPAPEEPKAKKPKSKPESEPELKPESETREVTE